MGKEDTASAESSLLPVVEMNALGGCTETSFTARGLESGNASFNIRSTVSMRGSAV